MRMVNEFLATAPFDIYELHLFHLVVKHRSFTRAAAAAGITQSAITRQMQNMENSLGMDLLNRTTRSVEVTEAGQFLYRESARLLGSVDATLQQLREEFGGVRKQVRLGVSRSISHSYLPGFLHANLQREPLVACRLSCRASGEILNALEANELDVGIINRPPRVPRTLRVTHSFADRFCVVAPGELVKNRKVPSTRRDWIKWADSQNWLLLDESATTGRELRKWCLQMGWQLAPGTEFDSFDLILHLVALGLGVSLVPIRSLALFGRKQQLIRLDPPRPFERELVVVVRKHRTMPGHLARFVENILF
jgi:DNA-binding transcriptional LysR family regulator